MSRVAEQSFPKNSLDSSNASLPGDDVYSRHRDAGTFGSARVIRFQSTEHERLVAS